MKTPEQFTITIDSVLGGQSEYRNFSREGQFLESLGIDPDLPEDTASLEQIATGSPSLTFRAKNFKGSGLIRPTGISNYNTTVAAAPMWMETTPKDSLLYVYGSTGSVYAIDFPNVTHNNLTDLNDGGSASGNGFRYYDNYIYAARDTTIARYGPLDGSPSWTDDYWVGTLGKTALVNTTYPTLVTGKVKLPNHVLHRHNDGKLYIADVVNNQGYIHYIATTKTTVEGDTDNGSTYQKLDLPYGYWPITMESYGSDLVIALYEGSNSKTNYQKTAKLAFWDTVSENYYKIVDFPDSIITGLKFDPVTGVLYVFAGQLGRFGTRVSRFVGGYSFEQIALIDDSEPPFPGAVESSLNRIFFGGTVRSVLNDPDQSDWRGCTWAIGSLLSRGEKPLFNIGGNSTQEQTVTGRTEVTSLKTVLLEGISYLRPLTGYYDGLNNGRIDGPEQNTSEAFNALTFDSIFRSEIFKIGQPFKIIQVKFSTTRRPNADVVIEPSIFTDGGENQTSDSGDQDYEQFSLPTINSDFNKKRVSLRTLDTATEKNPPTGGHDFFLQFAFRGATTHAQSIKLPITIVGELLDD